MGHTAFVTLAHTSIVNRIIDPAKGCVDLIKSLLNAGLICDVEDMCSGDEICAAGGFFHLCDGTFQRRGGEIDQGYSSGAFTGESNRGCQAYT